MGRDVTVGEDTNILSYVDAFDVAEYAVPAVQWACGAGVLTGTADGRLNPAGTAACPFYRPGDDYRTARRQ